MISARVLADSISPLGDRLITMELVCHRFVLAELNTHRVFSRNSASSRAVPVGKMIGRFMNDPAYPISWPAEQKGMQGGEELTGAALDDAQRLFGRTHSKILGILQGYLDTHEPEQRLHKSLLNRLMEWGQWHTVVVTATAWDNFFAQRLSPLAQPEIRALAQAADEAMDASVPQPLQDGAWHLPYVSDDPHACEDAAAATGSDLPSYYEMLAKISAARCARVSYLTQDGTRDIEEDLKLYERLVSARPAHWSPLEHVATPWGANRQTWKVGFGFRDFADKSYSPPMEHLPRVGNLLGWRSLRTTVETTLGEVTYR